MSIKFDQVIMDRADYDSLNTQLQDWAEASLKVRRILGVIHTNESIFDVATQHVERIAALEAALDDKSQSKQYGALVDRIEQYAAGNITGCGTCTTIINEIRSFELETACEHCNGTRTSAGPAGPNAYPCPFCTGNELGTIDEVLAGYKVKR